MKRLLEFIQESRSKIRKLNPDECVAFVSENGYMDDDYTFRMADSPRTTEKQVEKLISMGNGRKIYFVGQGYTVQGKSTFFKAFDGQNTEFQVTFDTNGKFISATANYYPSGKLDSSSKYEAYDDEKDTIEGLQKFVEGKLF